MPDNPEIDAIRAYADPATKTTLEGLSEGNFTKCTQYVNAEFKATLTPSMLFQAATQINGQFGTLESITFLSTEKQGKYTVVYYTAKFSKMEARMKTVFDKDHLVAGQWFE